MTWWPCCIRGKLAIAQRKSHIMVSMEIRLEGVTTNVGPGDFDAAMKGIKAKALVLPSQTDLYFRQSSSIS